MNSANDNQEKLPNNGWWMVGVFVLAFAAVLLVTVFRAYGSETVEVKYRGLVDIRDETGTVSG